MLIPVLLSEKSPSPGPWRGTFLVEAAIIAFLFWADIHHFGHVVILSKTPYLFILGWISLYLRKRTWRSIGMTAPPNWPRTLLFGLAAGLSMEALKLFVTQPILFHLFKQPPDLSALAELHNHLGMLALALALTWTLAAFGEELAWRGYVLNRFAEFIAPVGDRFANRITLASP